MDKIAQIQALKRLQTEVDEMSSRIEDIVKANEIAITEGIEAKCAQIEKELEEIYELTDERVYGTRHFTVFLDGFYWGFAFDGQQKRHYFLKSEEPGGFMTDMKDYHIVIGQCTDASGTHYYEDGIWATQNIKEQIASNWEKIKEGAITTITKAYERHQKEMLEKNMRKLQESEKRLASVTN